MDFVRKGLADFNFVQKYSRYREDLKRRETWEEACDRVLKMHLTKYKDCSPVALGLIENAVKMEKERKILSSQRARQFGGKPILSKNWRIYNCVTSYCDRPTFFSEAFWLLLCGCGVGFSVQKHHVRRLPPLINKSEWTSLKRYEHEIPDTIEGWADAFRALIEARMGIRADRPIFNYKGIRKKGAPLSAGGKAPGPKPLRICLERVERLLDETENRLRPLDCFDLVMYASDAVLSGGVRRAASIALFSADDDEMRTSKTGEWYVEHRYRSRANISAVVTPDTTKTVFDALYASTKQFGEPGFIFSKSKEFVYNPCVEIGMVPMLIRDDFGEVVKTYTVDMLEDQSWYKSRGYTYQSGWQACNLVEVNCSVFDKENDALSAVESATILATAQAGYTDSDYLNSVSKKILEREALIGVSLTGMANAPTIAFNEVWQKTAAELVRKVNKKFASLIGVRPASRTTCVKPSGNAAVLLGCASGVHAEYAKKYIRNVQVSAMNPVAQYFKKVNPDAVSKSVWSAPGTEDWSISFPIYNHEGSLFRKDLSALDFLKLVLSTQNNWVATGTNPWGVESLTHNVSNTVLVRDNEWDEVNDFLWENRDKITGISLLPYSGDYVYDQPPFQEITEESLEDKSIDQKRIDALERWELLRSTWSDVNYLLLKEKEDNTELLGEVACAGGACEFKIK